MVYLLNNVNVRFPSRLNLVNRIKCSSISTLFSLYPSKDLAKTYKQNIKQNGSIVNNKGVLIFNQVICLVNAH